DNYHNNPLADLAQEKMKEINEAYETIQRQRKLSSAANAQQQSGGYSYYSGSQNPAMQQVRMAINRGDISQAERLLNSIPIHDAEWNFLMGVVYSRRGWMDEARRYLETAVQMDPGNAEYHSALASMNSEGYRPAGFRGFSTASYDSSYCMRFCTAWLCCNLLGGGGCYFLPCY
ncbi:MAG: tetratricopeptide repeat protein, partial [Oscillospiraceae bacterium]|nr:tetratricopeptide repeat protein [Oscillospiraceae bacterium]